MTPIKYAMMGLILGGASIAHAKTTTLYPTSVKQTVTDTTGIPPYTWQEHWFEHKQLLTRVYYDDNVAVYYDDGVKRSITWPFKVMADVWVYTKKTYGGFGKDGRLFVVFHSGRYGGGHPSTYFDASHNNRNVIDVGSGDPNAWTEATGNNIRVPVHEVGHIVEGASKGIHNSPSFPLWGDSKWMEIYIYDVLKALGKTADADNIYNQMQTQKDNFPRPGTQWFKNWFYPIYSEHGGSKVLNRYFEVLAANFSKKGKAYSRDMNWGEFVHFWSGAAGVNLKTQATIAFGWTDEWEQQFKQAQKDFPNVKYK
ncbi:hypothetical protein [Mucilaginibacter sp. FT3.2]|uniref:hypothetical protein n=1 Tax=Mucilaginibacter sp. FT3.2 TaxID=2723090 RepID=UPI00160A125E|nr:hypothetical protein [Mucilaginibacter sp. FT3.2]MBB6230197.1 hypothetical protein [Mucilaginibacter sp. FT3.2]